MTLQQTSIMEQHRQLIVNGEAAEYGRFPYFVSLDRNCGGALIAPDVVLTAGHCKPKDVDDIMELHVGTYYYEHDKDTMDAADTEVASDYDRETFRIIQAVRHSHFQRRGDDEFRHDFTLLKLDGLSAQPVVRINRDPNVPVPQQQLTAMGLGYLYNPWADDDDGDSGEEDRGPLRPDILQQVSLNYLPNEECRKASNEEESYSDPPNRIGPTHLCTFTTPNNDRDACAFDSGGPIIIPGDEDNPNGSESDTLVALVSWGIGCADPVFPGVNARVSSVSDWIDNHVCRLSDAPPADFGCTASTVTPATSSTSKWSLFSSNILDFGWTAVAVVMFAFFLLRIRKCRWLKQDQRESDYNSTWLFESMDNFLPLKRRGTSETDLLLNNSDSDSEDDVVSNYGSQSNAVSTANVCGDESSVSRV